MLCTAAADPKCASLLDTTKRQRIAEQARVASALAARGALVISPKTVESHVRTVFIKLSLPESTDSGRPVLAVLAFLQA
jgi:hypothetical protein